MNFYVICIIYTSQILYISKHKKQKHKYLYTRFTCDQNELFIYYLDYYVADVLLNSLSRQFLI